MAHHYVNVGLRMDNDDIHDALIVTKHKLKTKNIKEKRMYTVIDSETMQRVTVSENKLMFGLGEEIRRIHYFMIGRDIPHELRKDLFQAIIAFSFPEYVEVQDILWNKFFADEEAWDKIKSKD